MLIGNRTVVSAGTGHIAGGEDKLWRADGGLCVVVARVLNVTELPKIRDDGTTHVARLQVLANLAGYFDPSQDVSFDVDIASDPVSVNEIPASGATVIAVLEHSFVNYDKSKPRMAVVPATCRFMPGENGSPLAVVTGLGDRRVAQTLDAIRKARANHLGAVVTTRPAAATQPGK